MKQRTRVYILSLILFAVTAWLAEAQQAESSSARGPIVRTTSGLVQGFVDSTTTPVALNKWLGVPFAEDTSGANRWRPPVPIKATSQGIINATAYGPACMQGRCAISLHTLRISHSHLYMRIS